MNSTNSAKKKLIGSYWRGKMDYCEAKARWILTKHFRYKKVFDIKPVNENLTAFKFFSDINDDYWGMAFLDEKTVEVNIMANTLFARPAEVEFAAVTQDGKIVVVVFVRNPKGKGMIPEVYIGSSEERYCFKKIEAKKITKYRGKRFSFPVFRNKELEGIFSLPADVKHIIADDLIIRLPKIRDSMNRTDRIWLNNKPTIPIYS